MYWDALYLESTIRYIVPTWNDFLEVMKLRGVMIKQQVYWIATVLFSLLQMLNSTTEQVLIWIKVDKFDH